MALNADDVAVLAHPGYSQRDSGTSDILCDVTVPDFPVMLLVPLLARLAPWVASTVLDRGGEPVFLIQVGVPVE